MQELDDFALLREYAERDSEEAFATLVTRHVNKVYSVALRHTGNPHQAEEITQAVFVILARKSRHLGKRVILSGWLYQTARLTALTLIRGEIRRVRREQEAYMQTVLNEKEADVWPQIAPLLDSAMGGLNETDRHAVVLRFFDGKSMKEVGLALGGSENAAKMRVNRAVDKLRHFFLKRGVVSTSAVIAGAISTNSVQAAPAALAKSVTLVAIAKGAAASGSTLTLAKATLVAMKWLNAKTIVTTITVAAVVLGTGTFLVYQSKTVRAAAAAPRDAVPIQFANNARVGWTSDSVLNGLGDFWAGGTIPDNDKFLSDIDPDTRRTTNSAPAGHLKSLVPPTSTGSADYLKSLPGSTGLGLAAARYFYYAVTKDSVLLNKHIRIAGWIKTSDVQNWAGVHAIIANSGGRVFAVDWMTDHPIRGTTDWQQVEIVTDVPGEPCNIIFSPVLYGTGELWCDDFQIDIVPRGTPITDDRIWHVWSPNPIDYSETTDHDSFHNGHPTLCLAYTPPGAAPQGSWMWWGQCIRTPDKYLGHTVRMTVWTKTENVSGRLRPNLRPKGPNLQLLAQDRMAGRRILGSTDWTQRTITCVVPEETQCLDTGFAFFGSGRVWIDMDSLKYEIVK